ncbi:MAG: S1 RNA-binding domain-containing protein, partial [Pseudomonadota bacterium]
RRVGELLGIELAESPLSYVGNRFEEFARVDAHCCEGPRRVGEILKVVKIVDFGAFVNFFGKRDGLVHVSQIENRRLNHPSDVLKEGQEVWVKLLGFDDRGKVRLSMKVVDQESGEEAKKEEPAE